MKANVSGWFKQSLRHSNARRFGRAGGKYSTKINITDQVEKNPTVVGVGSVYNKRARRELRRYGDVKNGWDWTTQAMFQTQGKKFIVGRNYNGFTYTGRTATKGFKRVFEFEDKYNQRYAFTRGEIRQLSN